MELLDCFLKRMYDCSMRMSEEAGQGKCEEDVQNVSSDKLLRFITYDRLSMLDSMCYMLTVSRREQTQLTKQERAATPQKPSSGERPKTHLDTNTDTMCI